MNSQKSFSEIPTIDVGPLIAGAQDPAYQQTVQQLADAAHHVGFAQLIGHGLEEQQGDLLEVTKRFFALPEAQKMAVYIGNSSNHRGYVPFGEEIMASGLPDTKEAFDLSIDLPADHPAVLSGTPLIGPNQWPQLEGFRDAVMAYYNAVFELGKAIFRAFAVGLGQDPELFLRYVTIPPSQLRLLHYPLNEAVVDRPGIGEHTDYECFTLLKPTAPGLEVFNTAGEWIPVLYNPQALVLNIGDLLELWTNGYYVATSHRVKKVKEERYAFPLFFTVDYDTEVAPLEQFKKDGDPKPLVSGEHLRAQTMQSFRYMLDRVKKGEVTLPEGALPYYSLGREADAVHR
ncbi:MULTISPECIES: isopenicillin N synthase family oxygenase [unclassified Pseudomonas]|uniref:isopenicillin N synthase family dioxygenase n=1 Tax=unclassified Pseudomonas TaxID=196821 RepID=UPI000C88D889|nr:MULTISPECIES: 2-oxoglutarate and iron-dependent oxygenase domain-containing protein [unclassified Pseudomonas]PMX20922.1 2OG-Fe(II) oxygenase [Pseudomonas sp. GW460-12]PMX31438.1 2OG-Fe(II) oxygenase [Pseudomonas sp. MPR-R2A4]PMX38639.1 2OG-Fe(II) oxygenase [Pseudomonas sp. MPR-R2A7]PMX52191.1 2OG-Fe(II) oxygenase [Pseudomonas sp. MPR-R2A6]PMX86647.1 2OG-Fe(II) oxygenase [Pseudomonas sp. MPR-R2A3]